MGGSSVSRCGPVRRRSSRSSASVKRPASQAYAGALRAARYDPRVPAGPSLGQRRAVRRELTRGSIADRLRGLVAIPPGAPR